MSKHDDLDLPPGPADDLWIHDLGRSDDTLDTPRHLFYGSHPNVGDDEFASAGDLLVQAAPVERTSIADADWYAAITRTPAIPAQRVAEQPITELTGTEQPEPVEAESSAPAPAPAGQSGSTPVRPGGRILTRVSRLRKPLLIAAAAVIGCVTVGAGTMTAMSKDVALVVDGQTLQVHTMSDTVGGVLAAAGLSAQAHDALAPAGNTEIADGSTIVLNRGRELTVTIDGQQRQVWTTARTVDQALVQLGIRAGTGADELQLSANRSRAIPLTGLVITGTSLRSVSLVVGGAKAVSGQSSASTVGALLAERKIALGPLDRVSPSISTALTSGSTIRIDRVGVSNRTATVTLAQPADSRVNDPALDKGTTKVVQQGASGSQQVSYRTTTVNGKSSTQETGRTTVVKPKPTIIHVGTKPPAPTSTVAAREAASKFTYVGAEVFTNDTTFGVNWDGLAMCESTHNPKAVNANPSAGLPTYGLFQFDIPTWASVGGSGNPMDATPEEQLMRAKLLFQQRGLEPWACRDAAE